MGVRAYVYIFTFFMKRCAVLKLVKEIEIGRGERTIQAASTLMQSVLEICTK